VNRARTLVGRADLLGRLRAAADAAAAGRGQLLLLAGEAGIGKTAVATEAAAYARGRGARVLWASCWEGDGVPGYWPWVQVVRLLGPPDAPAAPSLARLAGRAAAPAPPDDAPAEAARFQLFDELTAALLEAAAAAPLLVVLDDLQWADAPSLLLLRFLARRLHGAAVLLLGTYRDVDVAGDHPLAPLLAELAGSATVLPLAGLGEAEVAGVMAELTGERPPPGLVADVHRRTGGNPFFVQQVTSLLRRPAGSPGPRSTGPAIPPGVREAVRRRLARLGRPCAEALATAAVVGPEFPAALLARVHGVPVSAVRDLLDEAARARILEAPEDPLRPYRFTHDLFRESIVAALGAAARSRLHLEVARALEAERAAGGEVTPSQLANHFVLAADAGGQDEAVRYLALAAGEATRRLAHEEAARHWQRLLDVLDAAAGVAGSRRADALIELGDARRRAGDLLGGRQAYLRGADLARREHDGARLARAALGLHAIGSRSWPSQVDELLDVLEEAAEALGDQDTPARARVLASLARELAWTGLDLARAARLAGAAVATARRAGDPATLASCLLARHNAIWGPGNAAARLALTGEIVALAGRGGERELLVEARLLRVADLLELADPAAHAELAEAVRAAEALRQPRFRHAALTRRAMLALLTGRLGEVEALIGEAAALGEEIGEPDARDVQHEQLWDLRSAQGRRTELLEQMRALLPDGTPQWHGILALSLLERGDLEGAEAAAGALPEVGAAAPKDRNWMVAAAYGSELLAAGGDRGTRERLYDALAPYAGGAVVVGAAITVKGAVDHHLGLLAAALARPDAAAAHFRRALAAHERLGARPWALRSRYELARLRLADPGARDAARATLAAVARDAGRLGMAELAARAEARHRAAGDAVAARGTFRRDGAVWTLGFAGTTVRMRDAKGLRDLAALLRAPGVPVRAAELVAAAGGGDAGMADLRMGADELLDERARRELRARLAELEAEVEEAERWADPERAARAADERDALLRELAAAVGLGGRARRLGDQGERARKAVTARIRDVIVRIDRLHPALAAHLRASVTTGTSCAYSPAAPTAWDL
jgi:hypothetical protein